MNIIPNVSMPDINRYTFAFLFILKYYLSIIYQVIFQRPFRNVQVQIMYKQHVNFMIGIWVWSNQTALRFGVSFN